jgi:hypothetical protein
METSRPDVRPILGVAYRVGVAMTAPSLEERIAEAIKAYTEQLRRWETYASIIDPDQVLGGEARTLLPECLETLAAHETEMRETSVRCIRDVRQQMTNYYEPELKRLRERLALWSADASDACGLRAQLATAREALEFVSHIDRLDPGTPGRPVMVSPSELADLVRWVLSQCRDTAKLALAKLDAEAVK